MPDSIADFPLRGATSEQLGGSLARCLGEYWAWHGQAMTVATFVQDVNEGARVAIADKLHEYLDLAESSEYILKTAWANDNESIANSLAEHQLAVATQGGKIAAVVMLHNASERFFWRLVRFGLVANRTQCVRWIAQRKVTVEMLAAQPIDDLIDGLLEKWWDELERNSLVDKWDQLIGLVGFPSKLISPPWHFDKAMLSKFDEVRHNAVHHDGQSVKAFNLSEFAQQLWRALFVWVLHVASVLKVKIPGELLLAPA